MAAWYDNASKGASNFPDSNRGSFNRWSGAGSGPMQNTYRGAAVGTAGGIDPATGGLLGASGAFGNMDKPGGYLGGLFGGPGGSSKGFDQPFFPYGEPPQYGGDSSGATPNREALDFMKDYGTQPLNQESPWMAMQREQGQRQLNRDLGGIDSQSQSAYQQQVGNLAAAGGIDPATKARLAQTSGRAGMMASQQARGGYQDFLGQAGSTDLQQRLGMSQAVAGLEPSYADAQRNADRFQFQADTDRWGMMQQAGENRLLANAIAGSGTNSMFPQNMGLGGLFPNMPSPGGGGGGGPNIPRFDRPQWAPSNKMVPRNPWG